MLVDGSDVGLKTGLDLKTIFKGLGLVFWFHGLGLNLGLDLKGLVILKIFWS